MDAETLDLIVGLVATMWARPMDDYELSAWRRHLAPEIGAPLDPDFVAEALQLAKHSPAFEHMRPDLVAFRSFYERVVRAHEPPPVDPADKLASAETLQTVLAEARECLSQVREHRESLERTRSALLRAIDRADIAQGQLL